MLRLRLLGRLCAGAGGPGARAGRGQHCPGLPHFARGAHALAAGGCGVDSATSFRRLFDVDPAARPALAPSPAPATGLGGFGGLCGPADFRPAMLQTRDTCSRLVADVVAQHSSMSPVEVVERFDLLSNELCLILDLCEALRNLHGDQAFHTEYLAVLTFLTEFMEELNTTPELHAALRYAVDHPDFPDTDAETQNNALNLLHDFEQSGIYLAAEVRDRYVQLMGSLAEVMRAWDAADAPTTTVKVEADLIVKEFPSCKNLVMDGFVYLPGNEEQLLNTASMTTNPKLKELFLEKAQALGSSRSELLDRMLELRHELAQTVGYKTFAHKAMERSMAGDPELVLEFLSKLSARLRPALETECERIFTYARNRHGIDPSGLSAADIASFRTSINANASHFNVSPYLSIGGLLDGLDLMSRQLFRIRLEPVQASASELWHEDVVRVDCVHETDGLLGTIYFDVFARPSKNSHPSHYCFRSAKTFRDGRRQLPVIALVCGFSDPSVRLPFQSAVTVFHEFGHALHSIIGQCKYQNISGTRCTMDFVEVPSILFETFVRDYRVFSQFARHHQTNEAISERDFNTVLRQDRQWKAITQINTIILSDLDLQLHLGFARGQSTEELANAIHSKHSILPASTQRSHMACNHLATYGSRYYSYQWSGAFAQLLWQKLFAEDPFDRSAGQRYATQLLGPGGGADPWDLVENVLGYRPTMDEIVDAAVSEGQGDNATQASG